jgi:TolB-like protein/Flp pilus assembly protein TadD/predicted Ser/Thr protein kinase
MIGQTISHYTVTAKLGAGGMGEVYLAEDTKLKRKVALKFLPQSFTADTDARSRFQREAEALAALNHPNIVYVHDVSEYDGSPYIVMEYIEGQSLKELAATSDVSIDRILDIVSQVADGLSAAHKREIIHRDIKSENIIVSSEGRVKIMDFGLATWRGVSKVTKEGSTVGTMAYMSPEQAEGRTVDHRADLFSLGVVFYELITGRLPFAGDHEAAIIYSIVNETPEPLARYKSGLPEGLQEIVSKALEKDPELRHQTASGFLSDIRRLRKLSESSVSVQVAASPPPRRRTGLVVSAAVVVVTAALLLVFKPWKIIVEPAPDAQAQRVMLAVLPFENLGSEEDEYFADGITEEITTRVAKISALGVISRTSAIKYKRTEKSLRDIGKELGVDYVLEGTIRWDRSSTPEQVRINPQLIRVSDDTHLWAEIYDRVLEGIFAVQTDIAEQVATALNVVLLEPERDLVAAQSTDNLEAYNYYLRSIEYSNRGYTEENLRIALELQEKAVALDSSFSRAYAKMSELHSALYWWYFDHTVERLERAKAAADRALALNPDLPEAHLALGVYYYWGSRSYERALAEFAIVTERLPNYARAYHFVAAVFRRQGRWQEALASLKTSAELDPQSGVNAFELALTYAPMRRFGEFDEWIKRAITLSPDMSYFYENLTKIHLAWHGNTVSARRILDEASASLPVGALDLAWSNIYIIEREYDRALERVTLMAVLRSLDLLDTADYYSQRAFIHHLRKDPVLTRVYCDSALSLIEEQVTTYPEDPLAHSRLGRVYALLERTDEAIREGQKVMELLPVERDAFWGPEIVGELAEIYALVGEKEQAIDQLEYLMSIPSWITVSRLRVEPIWDPLRDHPRFQALLEQEDRVF